MPLATSFGGEAPHLLLDQGSHSWKFTGGVWHLFLCPFVADADRTLRGENKAIALAASWEFRGGRLITFTLVAERRALNFWWWSVIEFFVFSSVPGGFIDSGYK